MRMAVVGRRGFSLNDKAVDAPALIVGERPIGGSAVGAGCFCRSSIKVRAPCAVSVPARLQEGADDERGPAPESGRNGPTNALTGLWVMQAYALLAAVRGAFGAGVSRA